MTAMALDDIENYRRVIKIDENWLPPQEIDIETQALVKYLLQFFLLERRERIKLEREMEEEEEGENEDNHYLQADYPDQRRILKALLTIRPPFPPISEEINSKIDLLLNRELQPKEITDSSNLPRITELFNLKNHQKFIEGGSKCEDKMALWRGDITLLKIDCIVNAANSALLGCFQPNHSCIDNCIHTSAGPRLRDDCYRIMKHQNREDGEPIGFAKATRAYNLPSRFVLHTIGPAIESDRDYNVTKEEEEQLASCYQSCLNVASKLPNVKSLAFCCISTGLFGFPQQRAAHIAIKTVSDWIQKNPDAFDLVVFNVFTVGDENYYFNVFRENILKSISDLPQQYLMSPQEKEMAKATSWISSSDAILIAAGAGLSASAGLDYTSVEIFKKLFPVMYRRGFRCMYEFIGFTDWTENLKWGYLCDQINLARFNWPKHNVYQQLLSIVNQKKNYFVITSNADGMFEQNGFEIERIYTAQGDYGSLQCLKPCSNEVWPIKPFIEKGLAHLNRETQEIELLEAVPKCPNCGGPVIMNVRGGNWFIERPYLVQQERYKKWLNSTLKKREDNPRFVIVEIGAGFNTPTVIRVPCEKITRENQNTRLIRLNMQNSNIPGDILSRSAQLNMDATRAVESFYNSIFHDMK